MGIPPVPEKVKDPTYGFPNNTPGLEPNAGVALGSATVSPINMANGYATIANGGRAAKPYIIEPVTDADGEPLYAHQVTDKMAMNEDIAADVSYALQQVVEVGSGTAALGARPAGRRQDRHLDQHRGRRRLGLVHRLHAAAGDLGRLPPRQRRRQARRLAAASTSVAPTRPTPGWR